MEPDSYVGRVLSLFQSGWDTPDSELLHWRVKAIDDGSIRSGLLQVTFWVDCSDTFHWASADGEDLTPDNLNILEQAIEDLKAVPVRAAAEIWATDLFCSRVRKMRPMPPWLDRIKDKAVLDLFLACGPERTNKEWA